MGDIKNRLMKLKLDNGLILDETKIRGVKSYEIKTVKGNFVELVLKINCELSK